MLPVTRFGHPEEFRDFFRENYGPTIAVYKSLADDADRTAALDDALVALARDHSVATDPFRLEWEYLVTVMRRV